MEINIQPLGGDLNVTNKNLLFARPLVLSAARVRENWFLGPKSMVPF